MENIVKEIFENKRQKLSEVESTARGIYGIFDKGKLVYIGVANGSGGFRKRIKNQHASGNSCVSSFCNYLRSEKGITISTEEVKEFIEIDAPVKLEELKVQLYLEENVECSIVEVDENIKGVENYLLTEYFPSTNYKLWNFATRRSNKLTLKEYKKRLNIS